MDKLINYRIFAPHKNLLAFTTVRENFSADAVRFTGDEPGIYTENRTRLASLLGIGVEKLVFPRQTHSDKVCKLEGIPEKEIADTDALYSNRAGLCLCVQTADCVPILLFDPVKKVVAAVHAGWRGTVNRIVENTVMAMQKNHACSPSDILAAIGPSIGPEVYEIGPEVIEAVRKSVPEAELTLHKKQSGSYHFDLWEANRRILWASGLKEENIEVLAECSFQGSGKYFSARRDGVQTGRMVSGIMLLR